MHSGVICMKLFLGEFVGQGSSTCQHCTVEMIKWSFAFAVSAF